MSDELRAEFEKRFTSGTVIQGKVRLPVDRFHVTVLFGPSGCGKTTVLRCLAGLERPDAGKIEFRDETWFDAGRQLHLSPQQRDVGFMFQDYALFPHLTVAQNVAFGLGHLAVSERKRLVGDILTRFQLQKLEHRYPHQVSGGQQQRIALARVLVRTPRLLLLDEPLSALDAALRVELRSQLRRWLAEFRLPVIVVTHDRVEAMALGDEIVVMDEGRVRQSGTIKSVFTRPCDREVASIVGMETILAGEIVSTADGLAHVDVGGVLMLAVAPAPEVRSVHVCISAEDVVLLRQTHADMSVRNQFPAIIQWLSREGPLVRVGLSCGFERNGGGAPNRGFEVSALVTRTACEQLQLREQDQMIVAVKASSLHLIPRRDDQ